MKSNKIGKNLRFFAENKFETIVGLAKKLDVSPQSLQPYLQGESIPGGKLLTKLADLGCNINWLLTFEPEINFDEINEPKIDYRSKEDLLKEENSIMKSVLESTERDRDKWKLKSYEYTLVIEQLKEEIAILKKEINGE